MELLKMGFKRTNYRWYVCLVWEKLAPWNMAPENGGSSLGFGLFAEAMWVSGMVTYPQGTFQGPPMWDRHPCWHHPSSMGGHVKGVPLLGVCGEIPNNLISLPKTLVSRCSELPVRWDMWSFYWRNYIYMIPCKLANGCKSVDAKNIHNPLEGVC